jgi:uncharacterized oxidoreductase
MEIANAEVLITGGSSGIGLAMAKAFAAAGANVTICGRDEARLAAACAGAPGLQSIACDVSDAGQIASMINQLRARTGHLDILVNSAGRMEELDFLDAPLPSEALAGEIEVNLTGPILVTNLALPLLRRSDAAMIVMVGSGYGWTPWARAPVYSAAKAGVRAFAKALRMQLRGTNIRVMEIVPPAVDTPATAHRNVAKIPASKVAELTLEGVRRGSREVFVGEARLIPLMLRLAPDYLEERVGRT